MRKIILFALLAIAVLSSANAEEKFHQRKYALIDGFSAEQMSYLLRNDYDIAKVKGEKVYIYLNAAELQELQNRGFNVSYIVNPSKVYADWFKRRRIPASAICFPSGNLCRGGNYGYWRCRTMSLWKKMNRNFSGSLRCTAMKWWGWRCVCI